MNTLKIARTALAGAVLMGMASAANAFTVTFGAATDSDGVASLYDPASNLAAGNVLTLGLLDFKATSGIGGLAIAQDANDFTITCNGCVINKVTLHEDTTGDGSVGGFAGAQGKLTADGHSQNTAQALFGPGASGPFALSTSVLVAGKSSILVNVNNSLFSANGGSIQKLLSTVTVDASVVPLPPAVWMLGSSLVGLIAVGRRKINV